MMRVIAFLAVMWAVPVMGQVAFGTINADASAPVEVDADSLTVDRDTGNVTFSGNVRIGQGNLRIAAGQVVVRYDADQRRILHLVASGGVTLVTATEQAEAQRATYDLLANRLVLEGDVLVTQGASALSAGRMEVDLASGRASLSGRVRTVLGGN